MVDRELAAKQAYFDEQKLLDLSDDETNCDDEVADKIGLVMTEMPPSRLARRQSSFLGPTPKEVKADFEAHTTRRRTIMRDETKTLTRSATTPEMELIQSFPVTKPRARQLSAVEGDAQNKMKRVTSLPNMVEFTQTPFYQQMGVVPRELTNGKNVKPAGNIKLFPETKQLLRGKIVYFYPNDDISMVRRMRIHKVIQLGAAWMDKWRDDITHVLVDDANHTYTQLLRHLNRAGFPKKVILAKFEPYIPQCIQFSTLMDPSAARFRVKGAPQRGPASPMPDTLVAVTETPRESQTSLKIKPSKQQKEAVPSQKTNSVTTENTPSQTIEKVLESPTEERVADSFVMPSSEVGQELPEATIPDASFGDELLEAIRATKAVAHLPIDDDDEGSPTPSVMGANDVDSGTDEEPLEIPAKSRKKPVAVSTNGAVRRSPRNGFDQSGFQCMDPSTGGYSSQNPNARTIQILEEMGRYYDQMQDQWRTLAYRRGVTTLKKQTHKISTAKEAAALPFIGTRLAVKIEEIVLTNRLRKLDSTKSDPLDNVLRLFLGVYGAGLMQANKWIQAGHRTLPDLLSSAALTPSQKIGLEHYADFNARIPRAEVARHGLIVANALSKTDPQCAASLMGSYRRGAADSGDIDMLITRSGASLAQLRSIVFDALVPHLFKTGFFKVALATSHKADIAGGSKWHGASCLPGTSVWRRIDLLLVPECEMGAALIYFTGNDVFNRSMRLLARKKGMRLNQKGLYKDVKRSRRGEKLNEGMLVEGRSERRIFEVLGVPWREPHERIC